MKEQLQGKCQCGEVTYQVTGETIALFVCHCIECQRQAASAFAMALWVRDYEKKLLTGSIQAWMRITPSGQRLVCEFCSSCGTRLFHQVAGQSKVMSIKPGTLSNTHTLDPVAHIWTRSAQPWVAIPDSALQYQGNPPDFEAIFATWQTLKKLKAGTKPLHSI